MPLRSIRLSSFSDGPPGFFSPISHFCTVDVLVFRSAANTGWLTWRFSRSALILRALSTGTSSLHSASNSPIRRLSMKPKRCRSLAVSCIWSRMRLLRFVAMVDLQQRTILDGGLDLCVFQREQVLGDTLQSAQLAVVDIVALVLFESVQKEPAILEVRADQSTGAAAFATSG